MPTRSQGNLFARRSLARRRLGSSGCSLTHHTQSIFPLQIATVFGYFLLSGTFLHGFRFLLSRPCPLRWCWILLVLRRRREFVCVREREVAFFGGTMSLSVLW